MSTPRLPAFLADPHGGTGDIVLTGATLFNGADPGAGSPTLPEATVIVRDGRIAAVGRRGDGVPDGASVIDVAGRFVMPGLIDAHAHLSIIDHSTGWPKPAKGAEPLSPRVLDHGVAAGLRRALRMGVTTIRDVGAFGDCVLDARQAMRYGMFTGPRLLACGRIVSPTSPGGRFFDGMYREADGPDDVRRAVREQLRRGADFLKIMSTGARSVELENPHPAQCTEAEMVAFVDEAHRQGYRAAAHCEGLGGTELAVRHGCDTIEHGFYLNQRPDLLELMAQSGSVLVPTLSFLHDVAEDGQWEGVLVEQGVYNLEQARLTLRAARSAGVRLAMGFDSPDCARAAEEIARLVEHGLPVAQALAAATSGSAAALGIEDVVGVLDVGRLADVLVVDGDPLADHRVLLDPERIWLVLRNGDPVAGAALERPLGR